MTTETPLKPQRYSTPEPQPTLAEIAASVREPFGLRLAESTFADVQSERDSVRRELTAEIAKPDQSSAGQSSRDPGRIRELSARLDGPTDDGSQPLNEQVAVARGQRREQRERHAAAVQAALAPHRVAAGARLAAALAEIEEARKALIETDRLVLAAGGADDIGPLYSTDTGILAALAARAQRS